MRSKAVVITALLGLFGVSVAFIIGIVVGSSNAQVSLIRDTPAPYCFEDPSPDQFTEKHVETKVIACQVMGMTKAAAISFIETEGRSWRIASEDGESFALTEDYSDSRINLDLVLGLVVGASAW
jgi:hypothetical protein